MASLEKLNMIYLSTPFSRAAADRLEDMDVNKWSLLIVFIPIIGLFFTLYLCVTPSVTKKRKRKK